MLKTFYPFMKILFLSGFLFSSPLLFAAQESNKAISTYKGQTFGEGEKQVCEQQSQNVAFRMEELGYRVFDYTCQTSVFGNSYIVAVHYEYNVMNTIEKMERTFSSDEKCERLRSQTLLDFSKISAEVIAAFCQENSTRQVELRVDYKKNDDFVRSYNHSEFSSSFDQCMMKKERLEGILKENQVTTLAAYCSDDKFQVRMHYTLGTQHSLKTILGKKVESLSSCDTIDRSLLMKFEDQDLKGLMTFCSKRGDQIFKSVLFLDGYFSKVREFRGFAKAGLVECESRLQETADKLREEGHAPLYKYCQKNRDLFIPVIHYYESSSI